MSDSDNFPLDMTGVDDFDAMLDGATQAPKSGFNPGEKVTGTVAGITDTSILVDIGGRSEGVIARSQLEKDGELTLRHGDPIEAFFVGLEDGEFTLTTRIQGQDIDDSELVHAAENQLPIDVKVTGTNQAGLEITAGGIRGFCPISQIDVRHVENTAPFVGETLTCMILEYEGRNLVVSRRMFVEQQRRELVEALKEQLSEGDSVNGTVAKIMDFGVFVDIGGIDGLVPKSEIAWDYVKDISTVVNEGDKVTVRILKLDWDAERITLSLKQAGSDPWDAVGTHISAHATYRGQVTRLVDFGAFVKLLPGVEGLLHISRIGGNERIGHPREKLEEGQTVEVEVESIDHERRRISLKMANDQTGNQIADSDVNLTVGATVPGVVASVKPYGVFIDLSESNTGLLHVSEVEAAGGSAAAMPHDYPPGKKLDVFIKGIEDDKISLALPYADDQVDLEELTRQRDTAGDDFGSLGDAFDGLQL
mgnify:CR=1 FL=1